MLNLFLPYGKVVDIAFFWHMHGPRKGEPKGFCFVTYARTEEATSAIRALDRRRLHGRSIAVRYQRDADDMNMDARTLLSKARAKSLQQSGGGGTGGGARPREREIGPAMPLPRPSSATLRGVSGGGEDQKDGAGGDDDVEETALESKIRLLKAQLSASAEGGSRGGKRSGGRRV